MSLIPAGHTVKGTYLKGHSLVLSVLFFFSFGQADLHLHYTHPACTPLQKKKQKKNNNTWTVKGLKDSLYSTCAA